MSDPPDYLFTFAKTWNAMSVLSAAETISDIMNKGVINEAIYDSKEWRELLESHPEIVCALDDVDEVYGHRYYSVELPNGWGWSYDSNQTVKLHDDKGAVHYSKYLGLLRYSD